MKADKSQAFETDDNAMRLPLNELGWVDLDPATPELAALREHLGADNGIRGLEVHTPDQIEDITRVFYRDGFAVVRDVLDAGHRAEISREGDEYWQRDITL